MNSGSDALFLYIKSMDFLCRGSTNEPRCIIPLEWLSRSIWKLSSTISFSSHLESMTETSPNSPGGGVMGPATIRLILSEEWWLLNDVELVDCDCRMKGTAKTDSISPDFWYLAGRLITARRRIGSSDDRNQTDNPPWELDLLCPTDIFTSWMPEDFWAWWYREFDLELSSWVISDISLPPGDTTGTGSELGPEMLASSKLIALMNSWSWDPTINALLADCESGARDLA